MSEPVLPLGVCVLALNDLGQLLQVTRPGRNDRVCLPGGKVEAGESLAQAAVRELREETGLQAEAAALVPVFTGVCPGDGGSPWFRVTLFVHDGVIAAPLAPEEGDLTAFFDAPEGLLKRSPFASYNGPALRSALAHWEAQALQEPQAMAYHTITCALRAHRLRMHD